MVRSKTRTHPSRLLTGVGREACAQTSNCSPDSIAILQLDEGDRPERNQGCSKAVRKDRRESLPGLLLPHREKAEALKL